MQNQNELLSRKEAAAYLGLAKTTLEVWASTKRYPLPYIKVGKLVKYRLTDLQAFLDSNVIQFPSSSVSK